MGYCHFEFDGEGLGHTIPLRDKRWGDGGIEAKIVLILPF